MAATLNTSSPKATARPTAASVFQGVRKEQSEIYRRAGAASDLLSRQARDEGSHRPEEALHWEERKTQAVKWFLVNDALPTGLGKSAAMRRYAEDALLALGFSPAEASARSRGVASLDEVGALIHMAKEERPISASELTNPPSDKEMEKTLYLSSAVAASLADTMERHAEGMGQDIKELQKYVLDSVSTDPKRQARMRVLFDSRSHFSAAVKEFHANVAESLRAAGSRSEYESAVKMAEEVKGLSLSETAMDDRIRELSSRTFEPKKIEESKVEDLWINPTVTMGVLFADLGHAIRTNFLEIRESIRQAAIEKILINHLADLDASLLRQRAVLAAEAELVRRERDLDAQLGGGDPAKSAIKEAILIDKGAAGVPVASQARNEDRERTRAEHPGISPDLELETDRRRLIDLYKRGVSEASIGGAGEEMSEGHRKARTEAAAWAILRDEKTRILAGKEGIDDTKLRTDAERFALRAAKERSQAPSDLILESYKAAEREMMHIERAMEKDHKEGRPIHPAHALRLEHLNSQAAESLKIYVASRAQFGGDGIEAAARHRAALRNEDVETSRAIVRNFLSQPAKPRDVSKDAIATAGHAHFSVMSDRLSDAAREAELEREIGARRRTAGTVPTPRAVVAQYDAHERELSRWKDVAGKEGPIGEWGRFKVGAMEREQDARAARMMADPDISNYVLALSDQGGKAREGLHGRLNERAGRHEANVELETRIPHEERLFSGWRTLDAARNAAEAALADPERMKGIPSDMRAQVATERTAIAQQAQQSAAAMNKSEYLLDMLADAHGELGGEKTVALNERLRKDADDFERAMPDRAKADVAQVSSEQGATTTRGRTSRDAEENINSMLNTGEAKKAVVGHFAVSSRDAYARSKEIFEDIGMKEPMKRRATSPDAGQAPERNTEGMERERPISKPWPQPMDMQYAQGSGEEEKGKAPANEPVKNPSRPREEIEAERAEARRKASIKRAAAESAARDLRSARASREVSDTAQNATKSPFGNPAAAIFHGAKRLGDKVGLVGEDLHAAWKQQDPEGAKGFGGFVQNLRDIQSERSKTHAGNVEDILGKLADGKATPADMRNLRAYGGSSELRQQLDRGERLQGRDPRLSEFAKRARNPEKNHRWMAAKAPEILADIQMDKLCKTFHSRKVEYLDKGEHLKSGKNFEEGYIPTKDEVAMARAVAQNPTAMRMLLDDKAKIEALRKKHPGKTDEELAKKSFGTGRNARSGLDAERMYNLVENVLQKDLEGKTRQPHQAMSQHLAVGKSTTTEREEGTAREVGGKTQRPGIQPTGPNGPASRFANREDRQRMDKKSRGKVPSYGVMAKDRSERSQAIQVSAGGGGREVSRGRER